MGKYKSNSAMLYSKLRLKNTTHIFFIKLSFFLFVVLHSVFGFSQETAKDPKAKIILDELSKKTKIYTSIKAEFVFTLESKDKKKESQNGNIQIKGDKYKLEIKGQDIISDGKLVWTYLKDANEVQVNNVDLISADMVSPSNIFTLYETGYKYKYDKEENVSGVVTQFINLYPENPDKKKFHTVKLMVDKTKKQISGIKVLMKDGTSSSYLIKTFTVNTEMKDALFVFDSKTHPGVEVVDLR